MSAVTFAKWLFTLIGAGLVAGGLFWFQQTRSWLSQAKVVPGRVSDTVRVGRRSFAPVVRYTVGDEVYEFIPSTSSTPPAYVKGDYVEVMYVPSRPGAGRVRDFLQLWFGPTLLTGIGAMFFGAGILISVVFGRFSGGLPARDVQEMMRKLRDRRLPP